MANVNITFTEDAFKDLCNWNLENKDISKKILLLINDIINNNFKGIGKPEPLKYNKKGFWSRRINLEHRLIYRIDSLKNVEIISCKGHYE
jgi:toxin YoeB